MSPAPSSHGSYPTIGSSINSSIGRAGSLVNTVVNLRHQLHQQNLTDFEEDLQIFSGPFSFKSVLINVSKSISLVFL